MKVLCNLLKIYFSYVILKQRGDMVKNFICLLMIMALLLAGCSDKDKVESSSQASAVPDSKVADTASENTTPSPSPAPTPTPIPIPEKVYVLATSSDGTYSVCDNGGYKTDYFILNNTTGEKTQLMRNWGNAEIEFISDTQFSFVLDDYCIYNVDGSFEYRLSDYFDIGITAAGEDIHLLKVHHMSDGKILVVYYDANERITPPAAYNVGSENQPYMYRICVLSQNGTVEKTINTGKHVESVIGTHTALHMEQTDETNLIFYSEYPFDDIDTERSFELFVNLSTGNTKFVDYRPAYTG